MAQKKKMGRPPAFGDKPMKKRIFVLVSDETVNQLEVCKQNLGATTSDIVREGINRVYRDLNQK